MQDCLQKIEKGFDWSLRTSLLVLILAMLILTLMNIFLRWVAVPFVWVDSLVRHLVFLSAFLGGALASGKNSHIAIDIIPRLLQPNSTGKKVLTFLIKLITLFFLGWLLKASFEFYQIEVEFGHREVLGLKSSFFVAFIPFGLSVILLRTFLSLLRKT